MDLKCLNGIYNECLAFNFDISDIRSWDGNSGITISSLSKSCDIKYNKDIDLCDWGLTMYDVGRSSALTETKIITTNNGIFTLESVKYNDFSGQTFNYGEIIESFDGGDIGRFFTLSGGYLSNYFKLYGYNYELLPDRYNEGVTIEMWVKIDDNTYNNMINNESIIFYYGARSENKFWELFSGNTGYTTCVSGNTLGSDHIDNIELGVDDNVFAYGLTSNGRIFVKYIDNEFNINYCESTNTLSSTGWTSISLVYRPNEIIPNFEKLKDCYQTRLGTLQFFVDGLKFWELLNFPEFWAKRMDTTPDKQIGVPYNIGWGGGSFGLKHSYNFNDYYKKSDNLFTISENGTFENIDGIESFYTLSADTNIFYSGNTSLLVYNDNINKNFNDRILFTATGNTITLENNKYYELEVYVNVEDLFVPNAPDGCITIHLSGLTYDNSVKIIEILQYRDYQTPNEWVLLKLKIKTEKNFTQNGIEVIPYLYVDTPLNQINNVFRVNFDEFKIFRYDNIINEYQKNINNNNLTIEKNFNSSFYGGIQKLRFYTCALTFDIIRHNFKIDNEMFNKRKTFGGRLIYI